MNPWVVAVVGGVIGLAASALYTYLFAPAPETTLDGRYQSRWDWALAEGEKAAAAREAELRAQFERAKLPPPKPATTESNTPESPAPPAQGTA